jgi:pilus assembly protein CpaB
MSNVLKLVGLLLVAGLLAMIVRGLIIGNTARPDAAPATMRVKATAEALPQGMLLRDSDLVWKSVPVAEVPAGALQEGKSTESLVGALLRHETAAGIVLTPADVISASAPGFLAAALKPGMRAVSVAIDDVSGNAGLVQPGDNVDLLLTQTINGRDTEPGRSVATETVAQRIRLLAVGSTIQRPKGEASDEQTARARTVTLEVTPHLAEVIAVASRLGSLSLALRSFAVTNRNASGVTADSADDAPPTMPNDAPVWAGDISRAVRTGAAQPSRAPAAIAAAADPGPVIYRGSKAERMNQEAAGTAPQMMPFPMPPSMPVSR